MDFVKSKIRRRTRQALFSSLKVYEFWSWMLPGEREGIIKRMRGRELDRMYFESVGHVRKILFALVTPLSYKIVSSFFASENRYFNNFEQALPLEAKKELFSVAFSQ